MLAFTAVVACTFMKYVKEPHGCSFVGAARVARVAERGARARKPCSRSSQKILICLSSSRFECPLPTSWHYLQLARCIDQMNSYNGIYGNSSLLHTDHSWGKWACLLGLFCTLGKSAFTGVMGFQLSDFISCRGALRDSRVWPSFPTLYHSLTLLSPTCLICHFILDGWGCHCGNCLSVSYEGG